MRETVLLIKSVDRRSHDLRRALCYTDSLTCPTEIAIMASKSFSRPLVAAEALTGLVLVGLAVALLLGPALNVFRAPTRNAEFGCFVVGVFVALLAGRVLNRGRSVADSTDD